MFLTWPVVLFVMKDRPSDMGQHPDGAAQASGPPADLNVFLPGLSVVHPSYGIGRIVAIDGAGPDRKGRVAFTVGGERTFVLAKSPLKPLNSKS